MQAPTSSVPLRRQQTFEQLMLNDEKDLLSTKSTSRRSQSIHTHRFGFQQEDNFLDQMLMKHKNLIDLIDRRVGYRAG